MIASLNPLTEMITGEASPAVVRRLARWFRATPTHASPPYTDWLPPQKLLESKLSEAVHWARARSENSESKAGGWAAAEPPVYRGPFSDGGLPTDLTIPR